MAGKFTREEVEARLKKEIQKGRAVFDAFAGTGISAKFAEVGGADMITTHILARFRMAGLSSMAGYLSIADANAVTLELGASFELFLMVILGGPGTLIGPALGAGILVFLRNFISAYTERWLLILGVIYILTILYAPQGLVNLVKDMTRRSEKKAEAKEVN